MDNVNSGHRKRLRVRMMKEGLEGFQEHEILEMLLYSYIPRQDTNKLAHRLIDKYGSLFGVLEADPQKLAAEKGMSETIACSLGLIKQIVQWYIKKSAETIRLNSVGEIIRYTQVLLSESYVEKFVVVYVDSGSKLIMRDDFCSNRNDKVFVDTRQVITNAARCNAAGVILFHCHVDGACKPSNDDLLFTKKLYFALASMDVMLLDHIVFNRYNEFHSFYSEDELQAIAKQYVATMCDKEDF